VQFFGISAKEHRDRAAGCVACRHVQPKSNAMEWRMQF
jgi:hypothetical protein